LNAYSPFTGNVYSGFDAYDRLTRTYYGGNRLANPYWGEVIGQRGFYNPWLGGGYQWFHR
jgi:hypothetical protein